MNNKNKKNLEARIWWAQALASWVAMTIAITIGALVWVLWDKLGLP